MPARAYSTQQDTDGWVVTRGHFILLIPAYRSVKLADVFMGEFINLQFDKHMAFQDTVVTLFGKQTASNLYYFFFFLISVSPGQ